MTTPTQDTLTDVAAFYLRDPLTTVLVGLGISLSWDHFLGAMVLAMAGTAFAFRLRKGDPTRQNGENFFLAMLGGVMVSFGIAMLWPHLPLVSGWPVQFGTMVGGFLSAEILQGVRKRGAAEIERLSKPSDEETPS